MVINEVVDFAKNGKRKCSILKMGMCKKLVVWTKVCACCGSMSSLVNGSPTEYINIQRGLKQGDPLAPFLFLQVANGFSGLMRNVVNGNMFKGFKFTWEGIKIYHLQFADDTLGIGEPAMDNL